MEEALSEPGFPIAVVRAGGFIENNVDALGQAKRGKTRRHGSKASRSWRAQDIFAILRDEK